MCSEPGIPHSQLGDTRGTSHLGAGLHHPCEVPYSSHPGVPAAHPQSPIQHLHGWLHAVLLMQYLMTGISPFCFLPPQILPTAQGRPEKAIPKEPFLYATSQADNHSLMTGTSLDSYFVTLV